MSPCSPSVRQTRSSNPRRQRAPTAGLRGRTTRHRVPRLAHIQWLGMSEPRDPPHRAVGPPSRARLRPHPVTVWLLLLISVSLLAAVMSSRS
jgi:hypothetical protein